MTRPLLLMLCLLSIGCASPLAPSVPSPSQMVALIVYVIDEEANPLANVTVAVFNTRYQIAVGTTATYFGSATLWVPIQTELRVILSRPGYATYTEPLILTRYETASLPRRLYRQR